MYSPEWFREVAQSDEMQAFDEEAHLPRHQFENNFGIASISALSGKELLTKLFYSDKDDTVLIIDAENYWHTTQ